MAIQSFNPLPIAQSWQVNDTPVFDKKSLKALAVRRYSCMTALLMILFGRAIAIQNGKRTLYLNKNDLKRLACVNTPTDKTAIKLNWFAKLHLNNYLFSKGAEGRLTTVEILQRIHDLRSKMWQEENAKPGAKELLGALRQVSAIPPIRQDETEELLKTLKKGDIIVYNAYKNYSSFDRNIRSVQFLWRLFTKGSNKTTYNATHVALYVGDKKLTEASDSHSGKCVRTLDMDDIRCTLTPGHKEQYRIFRLKGPESESLGEQAAEAAKRYADEVVSTIPGQTPTPQSRKPTKLAYTMWTAIRALFHSSSYGPSAKKRFLKAAVLNHLGLEVPLRKRGSRDFFCSYFVGWLLHAGQAKQMIEHLQSRGLELPEVSAHLPKITSNYALPEKVEGMSDREYSRLVKQSYRNYRKEVSRESKALMTQIGKWAKVNAKRFEKELDQMTQLKLDTKNTSPQRFLGYMLQNPNKFQEVCNILPPESLASPAA